MRCLTMQCVSALILTMVLGSSAIGDEIAVDGQTFENATLLGFENGSVAFSSRGTQISRLVEKISRITWSGHKEFNEAEDLLRQSQYSEAIKKYDEALAATPATTPDWQKQLISQRSSLAQSALKTGVSPIRSSATAPCDPKRCYYCNGTGRMQCEECNGTGKAKCEKCNGKGKITCPACNGIWRTNMCEMCGGTGTRTERTWVSDYTPGSAHVQSHYGSHYVYNNVPCRFCGGAGYMHVCGICSKNEVKGIVACPDCAGTGHNGPCLMCDGTRKVPCAHCALGAAGLASAATAARNAAPTTAPAAKAPPEADNSQDPLSSPDALKIALSGLLKNPKDDAEQWDKLTTIQKAEAEKTFAQPVADREATFRGKKVDWKLSVQDVSPLNEGFGLTANSEAGLPVLITLSAAAKDLALKLRKSDIIRVAGTIKDYRFDFSPQRTFNPRLTGPGIVLEETTVTQGTASP